MVDATQPVQRFPWQSGPRLEVGARRDALLQQWILRLDQYPRQEAQSLAQARRATGRG
jgi:hypothetical protein